MQLRTLLLIVALPLAGCATVPSEPSGCPTLFDYSVEDQAQAADELDALPEGSIIARMIGDYGANRNEIRACRN